jgi:predicted RNA-binding protein YlxR (DUF448 family)
VRADRSSLLRVVSRESQLVVDEKAILPGRGAWIHPRRECYELALKKRAFGRALKVSVSLDTQELENRLNG